MSGARLPCKYKANIWTQRCTKPPSSMVPVEDQVGSFKQEAPPACGNCVSPPYIIVPDQIYTRYALQEKPYSGSSSLPESDISVSPDFTPAQIDRCKSYAGDNVELEYCSCFFSNATYSMKTYVKHMCFEIREHGKPVAHRIAYFSFRAPPPDMSLADIATYLNETVPMLFNANCYTNESRELIQEHTDEHPILSGYNDADEEPYFRLAICKIHVDAQKVTQEEQLCGYTGGMLSYLAIASPLQLPKQVIYSVPSPNCNNREWRRSYYYFDKTKNDDGDIVGHYHRDDCETIKTQVTEGSVEYECVGICGDSVYMFNAKNAVLPVYRKWRKENVRHQPRSGDGSPRNTFDYSLCTLNATPDEEKIFYVKPYISVDPSLNAGNSRLACTGHPCDMVDKQDIVTLSTLQSVLWVPCGSVSWNNVKMCFDLTCLDWGNTLPISHCFGWVFSGGSGSPYFCNTGIKVTLQ